jgi:hypothetical protein
MVSDIQSRLDLRFVDGIEKVEHVPYPSDDELWVRFNHPLDMKRLEEVAEKHGATVEKFGGLPSKLPRPLAEIMWDGVNHVIVKKISEWSKLKASLGFEPDGIARIVTDAHGPYQIFIATQEEGVQILYEYLGLKYIPPQTPKPAAPATAKPLPPASKPSLPAAPASVKPTITTPATPPKPSEEKPSSTPPRTNPPIQTQTAPKPPGTEPGQTASQRKSEAAQSTTNQQPWAPGRYRPHAWGRKVEGEEGKADTP